MFETNRTVSLLRKIFLLYGIPVSLGSIQQDILTHPAYPSMQSISDALDQWKVQHVTLKLTLDKLRALNVPAIVYLKQGEFVWVTQVME